MAQQAKKSMRGVTREGMLTAITIILLTLFGALSLYSILNTNSRNDACRSCRDGKPPSIKIGSVVTMPCGNTTVIYNSGNTSDIVLNFGIPSNCVGAKGPDANVTLSLFDSANQTYIDRRAFFTTNLTVYINVTERITITPTPGSTGIQGDAGPQGPRGPQGPQGPQGPVGRLILGYGRFTTLSNGQYVNIPIPAGATTIFYTIVGGGGGGGGGEGGALQGGAGGGGGSGYRASGLSSLAGVSSLGVIIGAGGQGGVSRDILQVVNGVLTGCTNGNNGGSSWMRLVPMLEVEAGGGEGGEGAGRFNLIYGGNGGDGGYAGGGGGSCYDINDQNIASLPGTSFNEGDYDQAEGGLDDAFGGGAGAGPNHGVRGEGNWPLRIGPYMVDSLGRVIAVSGGGGGGGGALPFSGGKGGSFVGSLTGSGGNGAFSSGGGGGGAAGNLAAGDPRGQLNSDLITAGDTGGTGGSGSFDYLFV